MYDLVERFLARVWVGDLQLAPTLPNYARLAEALGVEDLAPFPLQEVGPRGLTMRAAASWADGAYRVMLRTESVDIEYRPPAGTPAIDFGEFLRSCADHLAGVAEHFGTPAKRLAAVQEGLLRELDVDALNEAASRLVKLSPTFQGRAFEWDWRVASKVQRTFGGLQEDGNTIGSIKRMTGLFNGTQPFDRLRVSTDINTEPNSTEARFNAKQIRAFFGASAEWHDVISNEILQLAGVAP